jgi:hypothetical protein
MLKTKLIRNAIVDYCRIIDVNSVHRFLLCVILGHIAFIFRVENPSTPFAIIINHSKSLKSKVTGV